MLDQDRELNSAIEALTAELLKLSPTEALERDNLQATIAGAVKRLALTILTLANSPAPSA